MKKLTALVLALCMALGLAACGGSKDTGSAAGSTAAASGDTIKIGVYEPQSGDNGAGGKQEILGIQYANSVAPTVEIGGKTYNVKLEIVDNESSNDKAVSAASQLVSQGVSVVLGSYGSGVSIAASDTFKNAGVPAIGITCTNPAVTAGNTHYFRACFIDSFQGPVLANYAYDNLKVKKAYCLSKLGDDYSGGLVSYFTKQFEKKGGQVVKAEFPEGNSDFTSYIANAKKEGCGVFYAPISIEAAQLVINQAASQNLGMPILAGDTWDSNVILEAAKGTDVKIDVTTFYADGTNKEFEKGIKEWINADSTNLKNNGGFIPGVRPGGATVQYIKNVINRITLPGAMFLAAIAIIPSILYSFTGNTLIQLFGGTSVLIMVGVALDTMTKLESQLKMHNYDGFFK